MTPCWENNILFRSSQQTPSSLSRTLEGLFELTRRPSRALDSPRAMLPELQRYKDRQVWRSRRGGPRTSSTTTDANLDCAFVENALFYTQSSIVKSQQNRIELVTGPDISQESEGWL